MRHLIFEEATEYPVALLIKEAAFQQYQLERQYLERLAPEIPASQVLAMTLQYAPNGKAPVGLIKEYLEGLMPTLKEMGCRVLYVADAAYFKVLAKQTKAEPHYGYAFDCALPGYEDMRIVLGLNYQQLVFKPELDEKLVLTLEALKGEMGLAYQAPGQNVIHHADYPQSLVQIEEALHRLHDYPALAADIETFSLRFHEAGIGSIGFGIDQHNAVAFLCDYVPLPNPTDGLYGTQGINGHVRALLKRFLETYEGRLRWHNATFDIRTLIYVLWMNEDPMNFEGLLEGLHVMCRLFDDTKVIAYLATNTTAGNELGLKTLAHPHTGNYAQDDDDIKDIRRIPPEKLLEYNAVDCLATHYVYDTYHPQMVADCQEELYETLMLPSLKVITQMELTGMPLDQDAVAHAKQEMTEEADRCHAIIKRQPMIQAFEKRMTHEAWEEDFAYRKAKAKNPDKILPKDHTTFPWQPFNPNSGPQLQRLLYEDLDLPVIDRTKTRLPATGGKTLKKLLNHTNDPQTLEILHALRDLAKVSKILEAFIPNFEAALAKGDGLTWLHGNFNLGGTVSGRLSSSKPNLQQIPSGSDYGKLIKSCFTAPKGWLFCGADFNSLEDYISALTTKDPNKLAVYLQGYDGHSLRAATYFRDQLPNIDLEDPASVNWLKSDENGKEHPLRQQSKGPTFALTYQGTWLTLMNNLGFDEATAKQIEANYHDLYKVSTEYVQARLDQAAKDGYVEVAFGLRVRTPLLAQTLRNHASTPREAQAEGRTAGNALGQSYGLLNNRAANAFMQKVWASKHRHDIKIVAQIHDAIYLLIRDDLEVVEWVNRELISEMKWQELPEIQHDTVKLGAALDIFWPTWAEHVTLPNGASRDEIARLCSHHYQEIRAA